MNSIRQSIVRYISNHFLTPKLPARKKIKNKNNVISFSPLEARVFQDSEYGFYDSGGDSCVIGIAQLGCGYEMYAALAGIFAEREISFIGLDYSGLRNNGQGNGYFSLKKNN